MVERDITTKILAQAQKYICEVTKISDRFTKGIPDIIITGAQTNWWVEVKVIDAQPPMMMKAMHDRVIEDFVQFMKMRRLERLGDPGHTFYVFYNKATKLIYTVPASAIGNPENLVGLMVETFKDVPVMFANKFKELTRADTERPR